MQRFLPSVKNRLPAAVKLKYTASDPGPKERVCSRPKGTIAVASLRVLLVDDHEPIRRGIRDLLSSRAGWSVCGEAADGLDAIEKARHLGPDIVLMDISMPRMDGLEATRNILREFPHCKVVIITQNDPSVARTQAAAVGAKAFITKTQISRDLLSTVERVAENRDSEIAQPPHGRASANAN